jgi:hypothetical protein
LSEVLLEKLIVIQLVEKRNPKVHYHVHNSLPIPGPYVTFGNELEPAFRSKLRGPFEKFVDSPYYSGSVLCEGEVTSHFRSISLGKRCASYNIQLKSRKRAADRLPQASGGASELPFHGWKSPEIAWEETYPLFPSRTQNSIAQR